MKKYLSAVSVMLTLLSANKASAEVKTWQQRFYAGTSIGYASHLVPQSPVGGIILGYLFPVAERGELGLQWDGQFGLSRSSGVRYGFYTFAARWNHFFEGTPHGWTASGFAGYAETDSFPSLIRDSWSGAFLGAGFGYRYNPFRELNIQSEPGIKLYSALYSNTSGVPVIASIYVNFLF